ncbi:MAG: hypothetical protein K2X90_04455 [Candidatus Babeliaceae bacterium]|nr:hypothetical protein [Candidatus Babeliaceae bacterium]
MIKKLFFIVIISILPIYALGPKIPQADYNDQLQARAEAQHQDRENYFVLLQARAYDLYNDPAYGAQLRAQGKCILERLKNENVTLSEKTGCHLELMRIFDKLLNITESYRYARSLFLNHKNRVNVLEPEPLEEVTQTLRLYYVSSLMHRTVERFELDE